MTELKLKLKLKGGLLIKKEGFNSFIGIGIYICYWRIVRATSSE
jgi:hypothetical protein